MPETVLALMSGGVDSSVAAAILKRQGFDIIGLTMKVWDEAETDDSERRCCSSIDAADARRVCAKLNSPHYVSNVKAAFRKHVVEPFCAEYLIGRTPNPCIRCNTEIKFNLMLRKASTLGADSVATGHYARISFNADSGRYLLMKGKDLLKDQSYFLYELTQRQLARIKFPVGEYTKSVIRKLARELGLATAEKKESQEICFVTGGDYRDLLSTLAPGAFQSGPIIHVSGRVLGTHSGIANYTIGQRRGLGIAFERPLYVIGFDLAKNAVLVGESEHVLSDALVAEKMNWISIKRLDDRMRAKARIRYKHEESPATISPLEEGKVSVRFDRAQRAIAPGQAVVFYDGELVIGGGTIAEAAR
ncbi:MAG: tRNA 2-thiouridine(34) synthase MnmA [Candidatus Abyssobacteria bacterium SURF_5]|uniref:tRNA-specific 2-thiouridylase MnmA n=1 Tax=Abyssobacteria bacterium (strain SURF_5) TaxID=2093360 RepID=A0A3A4NV05_ABYX5|nr:MAG: tRNA 2-thiouridine(34) synthase MnmA [Candidatus Abyssubacteria bacterium SURF_5]